MRGLIGIALASLAVFGAADAQELRLQPGQVVCRDRALITQYTQRHPDLTPDPQFNCWPVAPSAQLIQLSEEPAAIPGRRTVSVQVSQAGFPTFVGYTFIPTQSPTARPAIKTVSKTASSDPSLVLASGFGGLWATSISDCGDTDSPNKTMIDLADKKWGPLLGQYENTCRLQRAEKSGDDVVLTATCYEFWEYFVANKEGKTTKIRLQSTGRGLIRIDGVSYLSCAAAKESAALAGAPAAPLERSTPLASEHSFTTGSIPTAGWSDDPDNIKAMAILVLLGAICIYFLPAIVAYRRGHHNAGAILVLNILLGWTFLGWVIAMVWASLRVIRVETHPAHDWR